MSEYVTKEMLEEARKICQDKGFDPVEMDFGIDFLQILVEKVQ